jgi:NTP pyrophosphatase (non-canonical NTP hydrolase)
VSLTLNEYQHQARTTAVYDFEHTAVVYPTLGLVGESTEVLEAAMRLTIGAGKLSEKVKKTLRDFDGEFSGERRRLVAEELGDVLWYAASLASDLGYTLEEVAEINLNKLADRRARNVISGEGDHR